MFDNMFNTVLFIGAAALVVFMVAQAFGFGPGGLDADEEDEVKTVLAEGEAELVDVRTPQEYAHNGLDGAKNIPVQQLAQRFDEVGDKDEPVVVYCRTGSRSAHAAQMLEDQGFEKVYDLGGHRTASTIVEEAR